MIEEAYCSFEVSKLLKEKGFDGECSGFYMLNGSGRWKYEHYHNFDISDRIDCPTHQMAMAWLRDKGFHINISYKNLPMSNYLYYWNIVEHKDIISSERTYEEAVEAALKYVLENLI